MADARRQERMRMRTNLGAQYRYDGERPGVGDDGYSSSDIEEDIQATMKKLREAMNEYFRLGSALVAHQNQARR